MALRRAAQRLHGVAASITRREIGSETARIAFASHRGAALGAPSSPSSQQQRRRAMSHRPEDSVYGGPRPAEPRMTLKRLRAKYDNGERISVVTAYDYPSAVTSTARASTSRSSATPPRWSCTATTQPYP
jgi:hypothetical protein